MNKSKTYLGIGKTMLLPGLLAATLLSCSKEDIQPAPENQLLLNQDGAALAATTLGTSSNLVYEENFEGSSAFASYVSIQNATSHALTQSTSPVFAGNKSGRIELRDSDPLNNDGTRSEVSFPYQTGNHRWYGWYAYFPSATYKADESDEVLTQWHQGGGYSPAVSLRSKQDKFVLYFKPTPTVTERIDLGAIPKDKWTSIVFHFKHSSGSDGLLEVYFDGKKVYSRTGSVMYKVGDGGAKEPKWKLGIYKSDWNGEQYTDTKSRIFHMDNVRIGNENATLAEMMAGGTVTPPPPPPADDNDNDTPVDIGGDTGDDTGDDMPVDDGGDSGAGDNTAPSLNVTSFVLVDADTDKDIMTVTNGSTVKLSTIGTKKFNIRANSGSLVQSVLFQMSGTRSKKYTDNNFPFTMQGDNGGSDYWYGNWGPPTPGKYTITATPYSGLSGKGIKGSPSSVSITFVK